MNSGFHWVDRSCSNWSVYFLDEHLWHVASQDVQNLDGEVDF